MTSLPSGTVTFVFTDIEASTQLLNELGSDGYAAALENHRHLVREAFERHGAVELGTQGDAFFFAFDRASSAVAAARDAQLALRSTRIRVRVGVHTGEPLITGGEYVGIDVHKAARIAAAGHGGQVLASEQAARLTGLDELVDLGLHRLKDLTRPEHIYQLVTPGLPGEFPPLRTLDLHPHNLPLQSTPLIGREAEVRQVVERLSAPGVRLLTLTGPAGTGKTRLSLAVGAELIESFPDGVYFVNLAPIADAGLVASAIAQSVGAREETGRLPLAVLRDHIREKRVLLVLDNFEHVLGGATDIAELIGTVPGLQVLVTSRIPLHVRGEHEYPVSPLGLPEPGSTVHLERFARFEAIRLFIERAQAVRPHFQVTAENAASVAEICVRLDGLPLAIELAAARIRILTPEAMLPRLTSRLKLLTMGPRDVPSRQQTLRGAIDWSHGLLSDEEKVLFRRLSVFAGGATLDAVEQVCWGPELGLEVLDGVTSLVEKSLLRQVEDPAGEPRVSMLETMNEYASEKLGESGEARAISRRHAECFLKMAERARPQIGGQAQLHWLERFERDHDNFRRALRWTLEHGEVEIAVRLAGALQTFWMAHGHLREGTRWLQEVLSSPADCAPAARAKALVGAGALARQQGDFVNAEANINEGLRISRELGDRRSTAVSLINLGALIGERGDIANAEHVFEEALALLRDLREERLMGMVLTNLGVTAELRGDRQRAADLYEESLEICRRIGDSAGASLAVSNLGHLEYDGGDHETAGERFRESLLMARNSGHTYTLVYELANLALVATASGLTARAARLFAAAEAHLEAIGAKQIGTGREKYDRARATARASMTESDWQSAWDEGRRMTLEAAVDYALGEEEARTAG